MKLWMIMCGALLFVAGCGPEDPEARYSGTTLAAKDVHKLQVFRGGKPDRPFAELGTIEISCPTAAQSGPFGTSHIEGGCTYDAAIGMASEKAAAAGADGIYGLTSAAGGNGNVVNMTAIAVRFTGPKPEVTPAVASTPKKPAATIEERLQKLQQLNEQKLITDEEYAKRKAEILKDI